MTIAPIDPQTENHQRYYERTIQIDEYRVICALQSHTQLPLCIRSNAIKLHAIKSRLHYIVACIRSLAHNRAQRGRTIGPRKTDHNKPADGVLEHVAPSGRFSVHTSITRRSNRLPLSKRRVLHSRQNNIPHTRQCSIHNQTDDPTTQRGMNTIKACVGTSMRLNQTESFSSKRLVHISRRVVCVVCYKITAVYRKVTTLRRMRNTFPQRSTQNNNTRSVSLDFFFSTNSEDTVRDSYSN